MRIPTRVFVLPRSRQGIQKGGASISISTSSPQAARHFGKPKRIDTLHLPTRGGGKTSEQPGRGKSSSEYICHRTLCTGILTHLESTKLRAGLKESSFRPSAETHTEETPRTSKHDIKGDLRDTGSKRSQEEGNKKIRKLLDRNDNECFAEKTGKFG